jgi:hypothetical protein
MSDSSDYLTSTRKLFEYYKLLGEKTFSQIPDEALFWQYNEESNSIAIIVSHLSGNMLSRWTDFLTSDGEKEWRDRDSEFESILKTKEELISAWEKGWACLFLAIDALTPQDLGKTIYIRNMGQTVTDAINRQLSHYPYHIGQIVFIGKMASGENWQSLSIPKGNSQTYNSEKFAQPKHDQHFADDYLKDKK